MRTPPGAGVDTAASSRRRGWRSPASRARARPRLRSRSPPRRSADRRADPGGKAADGRPDDAARGLQRIDAHLERLRPSRAKAEPGDAAGLVGNVELVDPVAGQAFLRRERLV